VKRAALLGFLLLGCAPSLSRSYLEEQAAAERAYSAGRYEEAADHWQRAAQGAKKRRNQTEARYRAATSLRRAGRYEEAAALLEALARDRPKSARAARAAFERAEIEIDHGDQARGHALLADALRRYPGSGLAPTALSELVRWHEDHGGPSAAIGWLDGIRADFTESELDESVRYARAKELEKAGRDEDALAAYLDVATRHPYPEGGLWDDALWNASLLEEKLGRPERAIAHLRRMLKEREPSSLQGSYERPRFAPAQYRIAELYRDGFHDSAGAAREFRRVWDDHPTSLLRDDALWNEARLERGAGDERRACSTLELLRDRAPESRYAPCVAALCPTLAPGKGECHQYVVRELEATHEGDE
jgi:TolA-binding protein